ncbi:MAG: histidine phosphatase family protein [Acidimicrobiia bacterium]|nr:histidine phosphatase family protein [Acidimicrobiia bacterium]
MRSITFLRHGESTGNASGVIQGRGSSPLSERGRMQAAAVGDRLRNQRFDLVVSSDMERAVETAEALDRPFVTDAAWREMDVGGWDGLTNDEISEQFADELAALRGRQDVPLGGTGETLSGLVDRISTARDAVFDRLEDGHSALVVCHGGVIETVLGLALGMADLHRLVVRVTNTSMTTVVAHEDSMQLVRFNDAAHLGAVTGWAGSRLRDGGLVVGLVRHGRTAANVSGHWQGQTDNGLNDIGRRQAADLAAWYGEFGVVYASPLGRAHQTAETLANGSELATHAGLAELGMGAWEGLTRDEIVAGWPELWDRIYEQNEDLPRGDSGETWSGMQKRVTAAISEVVANRPENHIGIVSHGAAIRGHVSGILGLDHSARRRLGVPANTSVSHVVIEDGRRVLADYNVAPHLE